MNDVTDTKGTNTQDNDAKDKTEALGDRHQTATRAAGFEKNPKDEEQAKKQDSKAKDAPRDEENLDEGLEESMDGSDTPSSLQP